MYKLEAIQRIVDAPDIKGVVGPPEKLTAISEILRRDELEAKEVEAIIKAITRPREWINR